MVEYNDNNQTVGVHFHVNIVRRMSIDSRDHNAILTIRRHFYVANLQTKWVARSIAGSH